MHSIKVETYNSCARDAAQYQTYHTWINMRGSKYYAAYKNGWHTKIRLEVFKQALPRPLTARQKEVVVGRSVVRFHVTGAPYATIVFESAEAITEFRTKIPSRRQVGRIVGPNTLAVSGGVAVAALNFLGVDHGWRQTKRRTADITDSEMLEIAAKYKNRRDWIVHDQKTYVDMRHRRPHLEAEVTKIFAAKKLPTVREMRREKKKAREDTLLHSRPSNDFGVVRITLSDTCGFPHISLTFKSTVELNSFQQKVSQRVRVAKISQLSFTGRDAVKAAALVGLEIEYTHKNRRLCEVTDDELIADAKKYETRSEWGTKSNVNREVVMKQRRHILEACTAHMLPPAGPGYRQHQVYCYDFADGSIYDGLTCRPPEAPP